MKLNVLYTPDGSAVIVASKATGQVLAYDPTSGAYIDQWNNGHYRGKLDGPWGMRFGPDVESFLEGVDSESD